MTVRQEQLRILHVRPRLSVGGATEYLVRLGEIQTAAGHRVVVATNGGPWADRVRAFATSYDQVPLVPRVGPRGALPNLPALGLAGLRLAVIMRAEAIDVVNTHHRFAAMAARLAARLTGTPVVTTLHEVPWKNRRMTRWSLGTMTVTLSGMMQRFVVATGGITPERVAVIPLGIDVPPALSGERRERLLAELGHDGTGPLLGCVGRLVSRKGHASLLRAMPTVLLAHPRARLVLVGDGPERATLEQLARELGVAPSVVFAGARSDAAEVMALCDCTVVPSLEEEFGIVILESFARGRPVVATDAGGIPELVRPLENGLLVPVGDSAALATQLVRLLDDPALARRLGQGALRTVTQQYTRECFGRRTEDVYRTALGLSREVPRC